MNRELRAKLRRRIKAISTVPFNAEGLTLLLKDIRILLEELGEDEKYPILKLHCDWVLHAKLSGSKIRKLLREYDEHMDAWLTRQVTIPESFANRLPLTMGFFGFEQEFARFLSNQNIIQVTSFDRGVWLGFELIYASLIRDSTLLYTDKKHPLKHIDSAIVRMFKIDEHPQESKQCKPGDYLPFGLEWVFMKDGEEFSKLTTTYPTAALLAREKQNPPLPSSFKDASMHLLHCWPQKPTRPPR